MFGVVVAEGVTVPPKQMGDISATVTLGFAGMVTVVVSTESLPHLSEAINVMVMVCSASVWSYSVPGAGFCVTLSKLQSVTVVYSTVGIAYLQFPIAAGAGVLVISNPGFTVSLMV